MGILGFPSHFPGIIKLPGFVWFWRDQKIQTYGNFEGFPTNNTLFGLVICSLNIFLVPKMEVLTL